MTQIGEAAAYKPSQGELISYLFKNPSQLVMQRKTGRLHSTRLPAPWSRVSRHRLLTLPRPSLPAAAKRLPDYLIRLGTRHYCKKCSRLEPNYKASQSPGFVHNLQTDIGSAILNDVRGVVRVWLSL